MTRETIMIESINLSLSCFQPLVPSHYDLVDQSLIILFSTFGPEPLLKRIIFVFSDENSNPLTFFPTWDASAIGL